MGPGPRQQVRGVGRAEVEERAAVRREDPRRRVAVGRARADLVHEARAVLDQRRRAADRRLGARVPEGLEVGRGDEKVERPVRRRELGPPPAHAPAHDDARRVVPGLDVARDGLVGRVADDDEREVVAFSRARDQKPQALLRGPAADVAQQGAVAGPREAPALGAHRRVVEGRRAFREVTRGHGPVVRERRGARHDAALREHAREALARRRAARAERGRDGLGQRRGRGYAAGQFGPVRVQAVDERHARRAAEQREVHVVEEVRDDHDVGPELREAPPERPHPRRRRRLRASRFAPRIARARGRGARASVSVFGKKGWTQRGMRWPASAASTVQRSTTQPLASSSLV